MTMNLSPHKKLVRMFQTKCASLIHFFLAFLFPVICFQVSPAQSLYNLSPSGGNSDIGTIVKYDLTAGTLEAAHQFEADNPARRPESSQLIEYNGKFYATTGEGGDFGLGLIYEWDPVSNDLIIKHHFNGTNGRRPYARMILHNNKLYGTTTDGGIYDQGTIFEYDPATDTHLKLHDFSGTDGRTLLGGVTEVNGKLYGITSYGGPSNDGVIYEWDLATSTFAAKISLNGSDGELAFGSNLTFLNGKLYGMTRFGGSFGEGVLFEYDPLTNTYTKRYDFGGVEGGRGPFGSLAAYNGILLGMTTYGGSGGILFEYDPVSFVLTKKLDLNNTTGNFPIAGLTQVGNIFYGATIAGSGVAPFQGALFTWDPSTDTYTVKHAFIPIDGRSPQADLTLYGGKLYGTTREGGTSEDGIIFEWDLATETYTKKIDFFKNDGAKPKGNLVRFGDKLYGTTSTGGGQNAGSIIEWDLETEIFTKKYDFSTASGTGPIGGLTMVNSVFYGMTSLGGSNFLGVIFEWNPTTNVFTKKLDFSNATGRVPVGKLLEVNGKLYGVTANGGTGFRGVLFEYDPTTGIYTQKVDFNNTIGGTPRNSLVEYNGLLYGTTTLGGANGRGMLFQYDISTNVLTSLYDFDNTIGRNTYSRLVELNGKLYWTAVLGGAYGGGTLLEWDPVSSTLSVKHDFTTATGRQAYETMMVYNGKLYGSTSIGGAFGFGVVYEYDPIADTYTALASYDGSNGKYLREGQFIFVEDRCSLSFTSSTTAESCDGLADGSITIDASGATNYEYSIDGGANWTAGANPYSFTGVAGGNHDVLVRDADDTDCETDIEVVSVADGIKPDFTSNTMDASCTFREDGSMEITGVGDAPFAFSIDGNAFAGSATSQVYNNLGAGDYLIQVQDNHGCLSEARIVTTGASSPPAFDVAVTHESAPGATDGEILVTVTAGTPNFEFSIDGGTTYNSSPTNTYTFPSLTVALYQLRVKDGNDCKSARVPALVSGANFCPPTELVDAIFTKSPTDASKDARFICEDNVANLDYEVAGLPNGNGFYIEWEISDIEGKKAGKYPTYNGVVPATDGSIAGLTSTVYSNGNHPFNVDGAIMGLEDNAPESRYITMSILPYMIGSNTVACPANPDTWRVYIYPRPEMTLDNALAPGTAITINSGDDPSGLISIDHTGKIKEGSTGLLMYDLHIDPNADITELAAGLDQYDVGAILANKTDREFDAIDLGLSSLTNTSNVPVTIAVEVRPIFDPSHDRAASKNPVSNPNGYCDNPVETIDITILPAAARRSNTILVNGQEILYSVYPVPSVDHLFLQASQTLEQDQPYQVLNMLGQELAIGRIPAGEHRQKISTAPLTSGIYMIRFLNPKGRDVIAKFEKR